tara:strand:- start:1939 stop:3546 length:1608 start_codon:yes stop_codon:yes gene_type:complete
MQSFKQYITEGDTSFATNAEDAIVYMYNISPKHGNMSHEDALKAGGMEQKDFDKLDPDGIFPEKTPQLLKIAKDVIAKWPSASKAGTALKLASEKTGPNHYEGAVDVTSKADLYGNSKNQISLKMEGDKKGAQLISSKSAEAAGCVNAAIKHWQAVDGGTINKDAKYKRAIEILEKDMLESARNDVVIPVKAAKRDLKNWYVEESGRFEVLKNKFGKTYKGRKGEKAILKHMNYELQVLGAYGKSSGWEKNALPEIPKSSKTASKTWVKDLKQPSVATLRTYIFPLYIEATTSVDLRDKDKKYLPTDWDSKMVRKQMTELIDVSVESIGWKDELISFFETSDDLKKWVVYEAGSGLYKFTGQISDGKDYPGGNWRVANKMLVVSPSGYRKEYVDLIDWSKKNTGLIEQMDISYKGSKKDRYIKFGIPTLLKKEVNESIEHELTELNEELQHIQEYYLTEGIFGDVWSKAKDIGRKVKDMGVAVLEKVKTAYKKFRERVVRRVMEKIKEVALKGVSFLLEFLGFKLEAKLKTGLVS